MRQPGVWVEDDDDWIGRDAPRPRRVRPATNEELIGELVERGVLKEESRFVPLRWERRFVSDWAEEADRG